jgi:hypothetical protein
MNNYSQFWNVISQSKSPIHRLDKYNYEKTFKEISDIFSGKGKPVEVFRKDEDYPDGDKIGLFYTRETKILPHNPSSQISNMRLMEIYLDEDFMESVQVDTHERSRNSHLFSTYKRDNDSFLYLADDFSVDLQKPEETIFHLLRQ